jgi:predicted Zn-dependent protease
LTVSHTADLQLMRASLLLESGPAAAARTGREILAGLPGHPEASLLLAAASGRLPQSRDAVAALESVAPEHRDTPFMQLELGRAYAASGRTAAACLVLEDQEELAAERYPMSPAATR